MPDSGEELRGETDGMRTRGLGAIQDRELQKHRDCLALLVSVFDRMLAYDHSDQWYQDRDRALADARALLKKQEVHV